VPIRAVIACALALALTVLVAACGRSPERDVRNTLNAFGDAIAKKQYQRLCDDLFSEKLVAQVRETLPCEVALQRSEIQSLRDPKLEIKSITVKGDTASAVVATSAANQRPSEDTVKLVKEDDEWRIQALSS
jgi:hypothetical protein